MIVYSFHLTFTVDEVLENESTFLDTMKIMDMAGNEYSSGGYSRTTKDDQTIISANFDLTFYDDAEKLTIILEGMGEVELLKKIGKQAEALSIIGLPLLFI